MSCIFDLHTTLCPLSLEAHLRYRLTFIFRAIPIRSSCKSCPRCLLYLRVWLSNHVSCMFFKKCGLVTTWLACSRNMLPSTWVAWFFKFTFTCCMVSWVATLLSTIMIGSWLVIMWSGSMWGFKSSWIVGSLLVPDPLLSLTSAFKTCEFNGITFFVTDARVIALSWYVSSEIVNALGFPSVT